MTPRQNCFEVKLENSDLMVSDLRPRLTVQFKKDESGIAVPLGQEKAKAMEVAMSPRKQILMNGFMMWISRKHVNIFSISMVSMALLRSRGESKYN